MRLYPLVLVIGVLAVGCVDTGNGETPKFEQPLPDDRSWPDGVYGRVLGYFESAGRDKFEPLPGALVEHVIDGTDTTAQAGASGRYALDVPVGTYYPTVTAEGYRSTGNPMVEFEGSPYETNIYAVSPDSVDTQAGLAGITAQPDSAVVIAHLVDSDTALAVENVAIANVTLTGPSTPARVGIGLSGNVDPAVNATVRNQDGNAAVMFFNVSGGEYTLSAAGGTVTFTVESGQAHVAEILVP
jgi:hypothetical protein